MRERAREIGEEEKREGERELRKIRLERERGTNRALGRCREVRS